MIWSGDHTKGAAIAVLLVAGCLGAAAYAHSLIEGARSQAVQDTEAKFQKQLAVQQADFEAKLKARDAVYQQQIQSLQLRFQKAVTPPEIAQLASQLMGLKQPIQIVTPPPSSQEPNPKPVAQISLADAPQAKQYLQECETCKLELPKLQADLADREAQMKLAQQQIESLKSQRDAAITASKGGSFWRRLKNNAKWLIIGAAGGAIAVEAVKH